MKLIWVRSLNLINFIIILLFFYFIILLFSLTFTSNLAHKWSWENPQEISLSVKKIVPVSIRIPLKLMRYYIEIFSKSQGFFSFLSKNSDNFLEKKSKNEEKFSRKDLHHVFSSKSNSLKKQVFFSFFPSFKKTKDFFTWKNLNNWCDFYKLLEEDLKSK